MLRRIGLLVGLGLALVAVPAAGAADDANRACDNDQDVTIVVDFGSLGGGVNVRCGAQPISNGFDVFRRANVSYETVSGSDFVCRIAAKPGPEAEDCANTPPGDAYWSYWYAKRGGEWKYSNVGPASRKPPPGSFEGWTFKTGDDAEPPRYPVPAAATPATTAPSAPGTTAAPSAGPVAPAPTPTTAPARAGTTATTAAPTGATTTTSLPVAVFGLVPSNTTTSVELGTVDLSVRSGDGGTSTGFLVSVGAITGLAATAFVFLRRRGQ